MNVALLLLGGVLLYFGAEWLVAGSSRLALSLRVPQLIVGLTVVAYGTSAPEIIVGIEAAAGGHPHVALGNVLGSNIANLGLILGIATLVRPARVAGALRERELPVLIVATLAVPVLLLDGVVQRWEAGALVLSAVVYTAWMIRAARTAPEVAQAGVDSATTGAAAALAGGSSTLRRHGALAVLGLGAVLLGGHLFVDAATTLARGWGMSERVVGLTIVAIGTSLPELATGVIAAARGNSDIAVGNVIGSNIFNVFICLGASGLVRRIETPLSAFAVDVAVMTSMTAVGIVFFRTERTMQRWEGGVLLAWYASYLGYLSLR